jgi:hypothetical protein
VAIRRLPPGRIAETYALALRARGADEFKIIRRAGPQNACRVTSPGEWEAELPPVRVRPAQRFLAAIRRDHTKIIEKHLAPRVARILLDIRDAYAKGPGASRDDENCAGKRRAFQH